MSTISKAKTAEEKEKEKQKIKEDAKWTLEQEELLAEWAEKAACYRWLHNKAEKQYRCRNYAFTIPVIILSTLTGTANFAMDSFVPTEQKKMAMGIVGGVNIFAGILSTLQNFLRYAELMEGHRSSGVSWSKFGRNITVELALDERRRKPATDFLKICRAEFDRLIEQSPGIDDKIINLFEHQFKDNDIIRPEVCNGIKKCKIYKPSKEEKVSTMIADAGGKFLANRKDHLKTAKSWKKLEVKQNIGDNVDIEKGNTRPRPRRTIQVSSDNNNNNSNNNNINNNNSNNNKEDNVSAVQSIMREPVNNKPDIVETNDKAVQEPEPELEPEQDLTLQIEDSTDEFLNGIESAEKP
jgi:hypothetical protein